MSAELLVQSQPAGTKTSHPRLFAGVAQAYLVAHSVELLHQL